MDRSIRAGITGFILAVVLSFFLPIPLPLLAFIPSFLAAIFVIYLFRLGVFKDGLIAAFMTYIFNEGILNTIGLAGFYLENKSYELTVDILLVFTPIVDSITVVIAGYVGVWLVKKMKPTQEAQPSLPPPIPPV